MTNDKIKSTVDAIKDGLTNDRHFAESINAAIEDEYGSLDNDTTYVAKLIFARIDQNINFVIENIKTNLWNTLDWNLSYHNNFTNQLVTPDRENLTKRDIEAINDRMDDIDNYLRAKFIAKIFDKFFSDNGDSLTSTFVKYASFTNTLSETSKEKHDEFEKLDNYSTQSIQEKVLKNVMINHASNAVQSMASFHEEKSAQAAMEVFNKEMGR